MKLKTLIFLEFAMPSMNQGSMTSQDTQLRPLPGSMDDVNEWNGIVEGDGWFLYKEHNNWHQKQSGASVTITEGEPKRLRISIKTKGLRKKNDTRRQFVERVRQHTNKVSSAWVSAAKRIKGNPDLNEIGNPIHKSWAECFEAALQDAKVKPYVQGVSEEKISPIADPVNFTPRI